MRRGKTHQHKEVVTVAEKVDEGGAMTRLHSPTRARVTPKMMIMMTTTMMTMMTIMMMMMLHGGCVV